MAESVCAGCGGKLVMQTAGVGKCPGCGMEYAIQRIRDQLAETDRAAEEIPAEPEGSSPSEQAAELELAKATIALQVAGLEKEILSVPDYLEKETIQIRIAQLKQQQSALGFFQFKEKKALQAQIDEQNARLTALSETINATCKSIFDLIHRLNRRKCAIETELTRLHRGQSVAVQKQQAGQSAP